MNAALPPDVSGQIKLLDDGTYEISSAAGEPITRQRFTIAHELGHYILHKGMLGKGVNDDTKYRTLRDSNLYNSQIDDVHERQANSFAANILIPEATIRHNIGWYKFVSEAARVYNVSKSSMRWRLNNLGLLNSKVIDDTT
ncbi:ImmA/IrrE family metallo-endopeptidase [Mesorhizobium sp. M0898]